jgi:jacalin-like lectin domain-containing protein
MGHQKVLRFVVGWLFALGAVFVGAGAQPIYAQLPPYVAGQQGPAGGGGGARCRVSDVPAEWRLTSINVKSGDWIDAIDLTFDAPGAPEPPAPVHCGGNGGNPGRVLNLEPGEFIIRVLGKYLYPPLSNQPTPLVSYLYVQTNKGKMREFGNTKASGIWFDYVAPEGAVITGFVIRSQTYVDAIGVILQKRP